MDFKRMMIASVAFSLGTFAVKGCMSDDGPSGGLLQAGAKAPSWTLSDPTGRVHSLEEQRGKLVLMDFWATWCGPCRMAMPAMQRLQDRHAGRLKVFGVNFAETGDAAGFMREQGFTYTLLAFGDAVAQEYGVSGIPCFYLIGTDGKVLWSATGYSSENERALEEKIDAALASMGR